MVSFTRLAILSFCQQQSNSRNFQHIGNRNSFFSNKLIVFNRKQNIRTLSSISSRRKLSSLTTSSLLTIAAISSSFSFQSPSSFSLSNSNNRGVIQGTYCHPQQQSLHSNLYQKGNSQRLMMSSTSTTTTGKSMNPYNTGYLNAKDAYDLDQQLFSTGYTLEQLMELAGLAVAEAIYDISPPTDNTTTTKKKILIVCGPGNNGGDGLVAARHLVMFGYNVVVVYPKRSSREVHYQKLVKQCEDVGIPVLNSIPIVSSSLSTKLDSKDGNIQYDVIVDSIFGFSFKGEAREPFHTIIQQMIDIQQEQKIPIVSVDVPSGWNVDEGDVANTGMVPDVLVSLTAPKLCSMEFQGRHFVGGRFLPPNIAEKYGIQMPPYPGVAQVMEITVPNRMNVETVEDVHDDAHQGNDNEEDDWALQYAEYCAEKESTEQKQSTEKNNQGEEAEDNNDDWAAQYQNYCIEKEANLKELDEQKRKEQLKSGED